LLSGAIVARTNKEQAMSSAYAVNSVRYGDSGRGGQVNENRELLIAGALFVALVIVGTAFFFAVAPTIADLGALYGPTT
jgi:hypothetical protein